MTGVAAARSNKASIRTTALCAAVAAMALSLWYPSGSALAATAPSYVYVGVANDFVCGLEESGTIECWGLPGRGMPVQGMTEPNGVFLDLSVGQENACALREDRTLACWGSDEWGAVSLMPAGQYLDVASGNVEFCALRLDHTVDCWGDVWYSYGPNHNHYEFFDPLGEFVSLSEGTGEQVCGTRPDLAVECWDDRDPIGYTPVPSLPYPSLTAPYWQWFINWPDNHILAELSVNDQYTCGIRSDGSIACASWHYSLPTWLAFPDGVYDDIALGQDFACALQDGDAVCVHPPSDPNDPSTTPPPDRVEGPFTSLSQPNYLRNMCGALAAGGIQCWGWDGLELLLPLEVGDSEGPTVSVTINPTAPASGWLRGAVSVEFACEDPAGVVSCPESRILDQDGAGQEFDVTATDGVGNTSTTHVGPLNIDGTSPDVAINGPVNGATYDQGAVPQASCVATDSTSGLAGECTLVTTGGSSNGTGVFAVTAHAVDQAGNETNVQLSFTVNAVSNYQWTGFDNPVNNNGHHAASGVSVFKAGSVVPLTITLLDLSGNPAVFATPPEWMRPARGLPTSEQVNETVYELPASSGTALTPLGNGKWRYSWRTDVDMRGYYWRVGVLLDDGTVHAVSIALK